MSNPEDIPQRISEESVPKKEELITKAFPLKAIFIGKKIQAEGDGTGVKFDDMVGNFAGEMRKKYPNTFDKAVLFHIIGGSTIGDRSVTSVDLPGGEITDFIKNTL